MIDQQQHPVEITALAAAKSLQHLDPGSLAELRRIRPSSIGSPAYWRLAARYAKTIGRNPEAWMAILRSIAILTPRGETESRPSLHDSNRRLGHVLCDGGNPNWPASGESIQAAVSEKRLGQLMSARGKQRQVLFERVMRIVARTRVPESGVNVLDIAWWLLSPNTEQSARRLAESYYQRLDRAEREQPTPENGVTS